MLPVGTLEKTFCFVENYLRAKQVNLRSKQWCKTCRNFCMINKGVEFEVAGLPCQPNSVLGLGRKENDERFLCYISWAKHMDENNILAGILENTHGLPLDVIHVLFGDKFQSWVLAADAEDVGHSGGSRPRLYILLLRKTRGIVLHDPVQIFNAVAKQLRSHLGTQPSDYLVATNREIQCEAMRIAAIRKITYTDTCPALPLFVVPPQTMLCKPRSSYFFASLQSQPAEPEPGSQPARNFRALLLLIIETVGVSLLQKAALKSSYCSANPLNA